MLLRSAAESIFALPLRQSRALLEDLVGETPLVQPSTQLEFKVNVAKWWKSYNEIDLA